MSVGSSRRGPLLQIKLENFLSFGPETAPLDLENLNILIGPNASGKSNFIEALALMRSTPVSAAASNMDLRGVVRRGGGASEWVWKGGGSAVLAFVVSNPKGEPLEHVLSFRSDEQGFRLVDERIENEAAGSGENEPYFYYRLVDGNPVVRQKPADALADFSIASNPFGCWSYGYSRELGGEFVLHANKQLDFCTVNRWFSQEISNSSGILYNPTGTQVRVGGFSGVIPADMLVIHPGESDVYEMVRWTCPLDGQYAIQGLFRGLDDRLYNIPRFSVDISIYILVNSKPVYMNLEGLHGVGTEAPIALDNVALNAGDTVDFVVHVAPNGFSQAGSTGLRVKIAQTAGQVQTRTLPRETLKADLSILAQLRDPEQYPEITHLVDFYERTRIYRDWSFGRNTIFREPQRADVRNDRLEEDFSNLGLCLSRLRKSPQAKAAILDGLRDLYENVTDFELFVQGGTVQVYFHEGNFTVPATRLSDGTLHYLCLLAILCDPEPPPLICIEEPELGLHPDILPKLADLLVEASQHTQLIVTTHSDILVDALSDHPEAIVVCEKHEGKTEMRRLGREALAPWLEKYRLGELWISGQIGGTRW